MHKVTSVMFQIKHKAIGRMFVGYCCLGPLTAKLSHFLKISTIDIVALCIFLKSNFKLSLRFVVF